jgi:hypothetical protein
VANNKQNKSSTRASKRPTATIAFTHKNYLLLALLVFATAVLLAATCFSFSKQNLNAQNWINARRFPIAYLHSNQTAITPAFTATISNIHEDTRKDPGFPLNNNEVLLIMDIAITNNSSTTQTLVPMSQLYMRDNQGNLYKLQPSIYIDDSIPFAKVPKHLFLFLRFLQ